MNQSPETRNKTALAIAVGAAVLILLCGCLCCCGATGLLYYLSWLDGAPGPVSGPMPAPSDFHPALPPGEGQELVQQLAETETTDIDYWLLYGQIRSDCFPPSENRA